METTYSHKTCNNVERHKSYRGAIGATGERQRDNELTESNKGALRLHPKRQNAALGSLESFKIVGRRWGVAFGVPGNEYLTGVSFYMFLRAILQSCVEN